MFGSSQGFTFTQTQAASPVPEAKKAKQEEKQTCVPVTARILQDAAAAAKASDSQEVLIHGSEASNVHLVGVVEGLVAQTAMVEFTLNDGSGRMKVRHYSSGAPLGEGASGLVAGRYVSVTGQLRSTPATHVSAMSLRAVTSADEVSYHMIETALAALKLRSAAAGAQQIGGLSMGAGVKASGPGTPSPQKRMEESTISPMKVDAPAPVVPPESAMPSMQTQPAGDLRSQVVKALREESEKAGDEGAALATILAKCQAPANKVQELMTQLVDEGEIYTTVDEEHFAFL